MFEIFIDGKQVKVAENTKAEKFNQVKVYSGSDFFLAAVGKIKNLYIETRHE